MSWGARASYPRMDYDDCSKALDHARDRRIGKPISGHLRIMDHGSHLAAQLYSTDIVRYYPDGSIEIATGYVSPTTLSAIQNLTGHCIHMSDLPLYNGRLPHPSRVLRIGRYVFVGKGGYIKVDKDGVIDPASVLPEQVDIIARPELIKAVRSRAKALCTQLVLRQKLGVESTSQRGLTLSWVLDNLDCPLEEVNYNLWFQGDPHKVYKDAAFPFARTVGAVDKIQFKEFA